MLIAFILTTTYLPTYLHRYLNRYEGYVVCLISFVGYRRYWMYIYESWKAKARLHGVSVDPKLKLETFCCFQMNFQSFLEWANPGLFLFIFVLFSPQFQYKVGFNCKHGNTWKWSSTIRHLVWSRYIFSQEQLELNNALNFSCQLFEANRHADGLH